LVVVLAAGCQVRSTVDVSMASDGSGRVQVAVVLDREAAAKVPDLKASLRIEDLTAAGWQVVGPTPVTGGGVRLTATRSFAGPAQGNLILAELSGDNGPFRDLKLARSHSFGKDSYRLDGTLDVSKGLDTFADSAFLQTLGASRADQVLGGDVGANPPTIALSVHLPGSGQVTTKWAALGQAPIAVHVSSQRRSGSAFLLAGVAVAALAGLVLTGALVVLTRVRSRRR